MIWRRNFCFPYAFHCRTPLQVPLHIIRNKWKPNWFLQKGRDGGVLFFFLPYPQITSSDLYKDKKWFELRLSFSVPQWVWVSLQQQEEKSHRYAELLFFFFDYSKASLIIQNSWGDSCDFIPCRSRWAITSSHRAVLVLLPVVAGFSLMLWKLCPPQPNMQAYRWTNRGSFVLMLSAKPWQQRTKGPRTACAKGKTFLCFVVILPCWLWGPWRILVAAS